MKSFIIKCKITKQVIGVEVFNNGSWSWYYNEMSGNRLERFEGAGRIICDFETIYEEI